MLDSVTFHYIGLVVRSIDLAAAIYVNTGYKQFVTIFDPAQNVDICQLIKENMSTVRFLAPADETSPVCKDLEKNRVSPYHICYVVNDIEGTVADLRKMKYIMVSKPVEAPTIRNSKVALLYSKNAGLIELVEEPAEVTF